MNDKDKSCTCIIPFYNEGERILSVLGAVTQVKEISSVICVDDGSTDKAGLLIKKYFPAVMVVRQNKNQGKSAAVLAGVKKASGKYIFLMDADLKKIKIPEIQKGIRKIIDEPSIDMIIFRQNGFNRWAKLIRGDVLASGQVNLRRRELLQVFKAYQPFGHKFELVISKYMLENGKRVFWVPHSAVCPHKIEKMGVLKGSVKDFQALSNIIYHVGFIDWSKQVLFFCRQEAA